ncbi:hypothetical protein D3C72_2515470 [compost metagenome]
MRAEVFHRRDLVGGHAVERDALVADGAAQRLYVDFVGRAGHVPGVFREHEGVSLFSMLNVIHCTE